MSIRAREQMLCLTDMWRAAGSPDEKRPAQWSRYQGAEFIAFLADAQNVRSEHILETQRFIEFLADALNVGNSHHEIVLTEKGWCAQGAHLQFRKGA